MVTGCFAAPGRTTRSRRKLGPIYFIDFALLFVVTRLLKGTYFSFVGSSFVTSHGKKINIYKNNKLSTCHNTASSVVDFEFEPRSSQTKFVFAASSLSTQHL